MQRTIFSLALIALISVALFGFIRKYQEPLTNKIPGHIVITPSSLDFGDIDQSGGIVSARVEITNTGNQILEIFRVSTSCGCTTATMDTTPLSSNDTRILTIEFDPMVHPDQQGPITRVVYIQSSDPEQPEIEINVTGNVISTKDL